MLISNIQTYLGKTILLKEVVAKKLENRFFLALEFNVTLFG